jgi:Centrosome localisation domain of PPC89
MTSQLQEHQDLIDQLRELRETDARQLRDKCQEVEDLRAEIDKLASEVERLRDIVESGLRERRDVRGDETEDVIVVQPSRHDEPTVDDPSEEEDEEGTQRMQQQQQQRQPHQREMLSAVLEETEPATLDTPRGSEVVQDLPPRARSGRRSPAASSSASGSQRRFIGVRTFTGLDSLQT